MAIKSGLGRAAAALVGISLLPAAEAEVAGVKAGGSAPGRANTPAQHAKEPGVSAALGAKVAAAPAALSRFPKRERVDKRIGTDFGEAVSPGVAKPPQGFEQLRILVRLPRYLVRGSSGLAHGASLVIAGQEENPKVRLAYGRARRALMAARSGTVPIGVAWKVRHRLKGGQLYELAVHVGGAGADAAPRRDAALVDRRHDRPRLDSGGA